VLVLGAGGVLGGAWLAGAVAASCAVPGIYRPVRIGDRTYVDGGAWSPSNPDCVARAGLDLVLCLNPLSTLPEELAGGGRGALRGGLRRATGRRLGWEARRLEERGTAVVTLQPVLADLAVMGGNLRLAGALDGLSLHALVQPGLLPPERLQAEVDALLTAPATA
jgi:NTE family protein